MFPLSFILSLLSYHKSMKYAKHLRITGCPIFHAAQHIQRIVPFPSSISFVMDRMTTV